MLGRCGGLVMCKFYNICTFAVKNGIEMNKICCNNVYTLKCCYGGLEIM